MKYKFANVEEASEYDQDNDINDGENEYEFDEIDNFTNGNKQDPESEYSTHFLL